MLDSNDFVKYPNKYLNKVRQIDSLYIPNLSVFLVKNIDFLQVLLNLAPFLCS